VKNSLHRALSAAYSLTDLSWFLALQAQGENLTFAIVVQRCGNLLRQFGKERCLRWRWIISQELERLYTIVATQRTRFASHVTTSGAVMFNTVAAFFQGDAN